MALIDGVPDNSLAVLDRELRTLKREVEEMRSEAEARASSAVDLQGTVARGGLQAYDPNWLDRVVSEAVETRTPLVPASSVSVEELARTVDRLAERVSALERAARP